MRTNLIPLLFVSCTLLVACQKETNLPDNASATLTETAATTETSSKPFTVRTIAGIFENGNSEPHLVNGPALKAKFWKPHGITVAGDGSIYVADFLNSAIRKITIGSNVYTAPLSYNPDTGGGLLPEAVGVGADGTLYIVSTGYGIRIYNKDKGIDVYNRISNSDSNLDIERDVRGTMWFVSDNSIGKITGTTIQRKVISLTSYLDANETLRGIGLGPNSTIYASSATKLFQITGNGKITRLYPNERFIFISGITVTKDGRTLYIADGNAIKKINNNSITMIAKPGAGDGRDGVGFEADVVAANLALANSEKYLFVTDTRNLIRKISLD
ncbi:MAG: hypothetical protein JKY70_20910 [Mucilaginibacter sp.]|nr:hypothetical protein [Mucilaginibacter sp.]